MRNKWNRRNKWGAEQTGSGSGGQATPVLQTKTATPTTAQQHIEADSGYDGLRAVDVEAVTASIDPDITPANIKQGVNILGVTGTHAGIDTSDATAVAADIIKGKTAYSNGQKLTGTLQQCPLDRLQILQATEPFDLTTEQVNYIQQLAGYKYGCYHLFAYIKVSSIVFTLTEITVERAFDSLAIRSPSLTTVSFPNLTTVSGSYAFHRAFEGCKSLTTVSFPNLTSVTVSGAFYCICIGCPSLTTVSFPRLETVSGANIFLLAFVNCVNMETHPAAAGMFTNNIQSSAAKVRNFILSATAEDGLRLSEMPLLTSTSVLGVLDKLSTTAAGKTCAFADITIAHDDGNNAAIAAKVAALTNWTITGLTIE